MATAVVPWLSLAVVLMGAMVRLARVVSLPIRPEHCNGALRNVFQGCKTIVRAGIHLSGLVKLNANPMADVRSASIGFEAS
jgi:hypothetical protein